MINGKKVVVVMPAYNAERTIEKTWREVLDQEIVDLIIIVDDASEDKTVELARALDQAVVHVHAKNKGYGANQKSCYRLALAHGADIVVMVHPDYQYTPKLIPAMAGLVASGVYPCVLGSRILGGQALRGGMPLWRYVANRGLTLAGNILLGTKVSEFHTGYRAFARELLEALPLEANSDDFVFDNQILAETIWLGCSIGEVSCPTSYAPDASSINFRRSVRYGFACLGTAVSFRLAKMGLFRPTRFPAAKFRALTDNGCRLK
ncbi:MAG: glycosyl transferase family 2 [Acidobacteria bacterium]|nr:MAG: glycosyl transferase family 2 [Acidobacteriota bacterium]